MGIDTKEAVVLLELSGEQLNESVITDAQSPERVALEKRLLWKIDRRLMPMMMLICETFAFFRCGRKNSNAASKTCSTTSIVTT